MRRDLDWNDEPLPHVAFEKAGDHVARKQYTCDLCHTDIEPGTKYFRHTAVVDGELIDDKHHLYGGCPPQVVYEHGDDDLYCLGCDHYHDPREGCAMTDAEGRLNKLWVIDKGRAPSLTDRKAGDR